MTVILKNSFQSTKPLENSNDDEPLYHLYFHNEPVAIVKKQI